MNTQVWIQEIESRLGTTLLESARQTDADDSFPFILVDEIIHDPYFVDLVSQIDRNHTLKEFNQLIKQISEVFPALASILLTQAAYGVYPILRFGTDSQRDTYLADLIQGKRLGAVAHSEEAGGSDIEQLTTTVVETEGGWILNGHKAYVSNGQEAHLFYVTAKKADANHSLQRGVFVVNRDLEGVTVHPAKKKVGIRAMSVTELTFENVFLSEESLLGGVYQGETQSKEIMDRIKLSIVAQAIGLTASSIKKGIDYLSLDRKIGTRLIEMPDYQQIIAHLISRYEAIQALYDNTVSQRTIDRDAIAMLKLLTSELATQSTEQIIHMSGGFGFMRQNDLERLARDARATAIYGGSMATQSKIIAKNGYKR